MNYLVILDPGHGMNTSGKRTPLFPDDSFMRENEFNRNVVRKIDGLLEPYENIDVAFTTTEKRDISLEERVSRVNALYDKVKNLYDKIVLISVHANALTGAWGKQNGTETYYYTTNNIDKIFADVIHKNLVRSIKLTDRGIKPAEFYIIKNVKMTACLCECAYMDNLEEAKLLMKDDFRQACAEGIVNGLKEYFGMNDIKVDYKSYNDGTRELRGNPVDLTNKIVNKSNRSIEEQNCVNGTFFYPDGKGSFYSTSILIVDGKIYQNDANHLYDFNAPQSVFIVYKNGKVDMKRVKHATELDYKNIKVAVGGVGLRNTLDSSFRYSPVTEGFKAGYRLQDGKWVDYTDVLQTRPKTVIGYNKTNGKAYLLARSNISHGSLINLISDNSTGEAYDIALSLDGGGSTFMNNKDDMIVKGDGRIIHNIIGFGL